MKVFLVSNDDGVFAAGISVLTEKLLSLGKVVVVAPQSDSSAVSHGITIRRPLRLNKLKENIYSLDGTPADCVIVGLNTVLSSERPSWVISGINRGGNLGSDTIYSGTVAAAVEAGLNGCRSMAVSLEGVAEVMHYETAAYVVEYILKNLKEDELDTNCILNVNVPNVPVECLKGVVAANVGTKIYKNLVNHGKDPRGYPYVWIGSAVTDYETMNNSDYQRVSEGYASVSVLKPSLYDETSTKQLFKMLNL